MKHRHCLIGLALGAGCIEPNDAVVGPPEAYELVWSDEFDGDAGDPPDPAFWGYDVGIGPNGDGWGNQQLEFNTDQTANVSLDGQGNLVITAREEDFAGRSYTSARIKTQGKVSQRYGRIEARMQLPSGRGLWPAFWMLGEDFPDVGWPRTGEIDIMEYRGQEPKVVLGSVHGPGYSAGNAITRSFRLDTEEGFDDGFHTFAVEWDPSRITWWVDDQIYSILTARDVLARGDWVFDDPFFIILNVAVGGTFVGPVGEDTTFPQSMLVDYVRIYRRTE